MKVKLNFLITIVIKMISDRKVTKKRLGVSFRQAFLKNHDVFLFNQHLLCCHTAGIADLNEIQTFLVKVNVLFAFGFAQSHAVLT